MKYTPILYILLFWATEGLVHSQSNSGIKGVLTSTDGKPLEFAGIAVEGKPYGTVSDQTGTYYLTIPPGENYKLVFSHVSYAQFDTILTIRKGVIQTINLQLKSSNQKLDEVSIVSDINKGSTLQKINTHDFEFLPNVSGNFENLLRTMGVASNNELSSQYSVRGGSFDENLVYVNDIEIYRPFLVRSGQQEGLSFVNPDMVASVQFSAGGFDAQYGDKLSSVLDIRYKRPTEFEGQVSASLLGGAAQIGGHSKNDKLSFTSALRYKTSKYLLGTLQTTGEYNPSFIDFQSFVTYQINKKWEINVLGNISRNQFDLIPDTRETSFGTISDALKLKVYYSGQEKDAYATYLGATTINYTPSDHFILKLIGSAFTTQEQETYDILGEYLINALDNQLGSSSVGDSILNLGIGSQLKHARNYMNAMIYSLEHKGSWKTGSNFLKWGIRFQREYLNSTVNEWMKIDSAGYSIPYTGDQIHLYRVKKGQHDFVNNRLLFYAQNTITFSEPLDGFYLTFGIRGQTWSPNEHFFLTPRATLAYSPLNINNLQFRASWGLYYQPPFYKEFVDPDGFLMNDISPQKSTHYVGGIDYTFVAWDRPFNFTTEVYYKNFSQLIPYKIDNVRIQYYPEYTAQGYAKGIEFKLNGEFVENAQSWISLSILKTEEDVYGDYYFSDVPAHYQEVYNNLYTIIPGKRYRTNPGYYRRPSDQRFNLSIFFQDYLPSNPDYKVHLNYIFGSRIPSSNPNTRRMDEIYTLPFYNRVDMGFSRVINKTGYQAGSSFKSIWISGEVLNLFGISNTISYDWVKTVSNQTGSSSWWGVPNYLTSRRYNLRITVKF